MTGTVFDRRAWPAAVAAVLIIGVGQLGRLPMSAAYQTEEQRRYAHVSAVATNPKAGTDVVVLGNSAAQFGIGAEQLERTLRVGGVDGTTPKVVNLAVAGGNPAIDLWLWRQLDCWQRRPKLLLVGVSPLDLIDSNPGRDYALRYLWDVSDVPWLLAGGRVDDAATLLTYRAFPLLGRPAALRNRMAGRKPLSAVAQTPRERLWWIPVYHKWYRNYEVEPFQRRCLKRLVREAEGAGARVMLVALPVSPALQRVTEGGAPTDDETPGASTAPPATGTPLQLFNHAVLSIAAEHRLTYLDYLRPQHSARFTYSDPPHLARESAARFTQELAGRINRELAEAAGHVDARGDSTVDSLSEQGL